MEGHVSSKNFLAHSELISLACCIKSILFFVSFGLWWGRPVPWTNGDEEESMIERKVGHLVLREQLLGPHLSWMTQDTLDRSSLARRHSVTPSVWEAVLRELGQLVPSDTLGCGDSVDCGLGLGRGLDYTLPYWETLHGRFPSCQPRFPHLLWKNFHLMMVITWEGGWGRMRSLLLWTFAINFLFWRISNIQSREDNVRSPHVPITQLQAINILPILFCIKLLLPSTPTVCLFAGVFWRKSQIMSFYM